MAARRFQRVPATEGGTGGAALIAIGSWRCKQAGVGMARLYPLGSGLTRRYFRVAGPSRPADGWRSMADFGQAASFSQRRVCQPNKAHHVPHLVPHPRPHRFRHPIAARLRMRACRHQEAADRHRRWRARGWCAADGARRLARFAARPHLRPHAFEPDRSGGARSRGDVQRTRLRRPDRGGRRLVARLRQGRGHRRHAPRPAGHLRHHRRW